MWGSLLASAMCACVLVVGTSARASDSKDSQAEELKVTTTLTYGTYGPPRPTRVVACDIIWATQSVSGLSHDEEGKIDVSTRFEILDEKGETVYAGSWQRQESRQIASNYQACGFVRLTERLDKKGKYTWRSHVEDHISGAKAVAEICFELVSPTTLAAYQVRYSHDGVGKSSAAGSFTLHEPIYVHAELVNFGTQNGRTNVRCTAQVLDQSGKQTDWPKAVGALHVDVPIYDENPHLWTVLSFNSLRSGKFIVQLKFEDLVGGTSTTEYLPLLVTETPDWTLDAEQIAKLNEQAESEKKSR